MISRAITSPPEKYFGRSRIGRKCAPRRERFYLKLFVNFIKEILGMDFSIQSMRKIDQLLSEYGESHQNETNKAIHWICVPLIFFSVVGLMASIPPGPVQKILGEGNPYANWATIMLVVAIAYYVTLSIPLTVGM